MEGQERMPKTEPREVVAYIGLGSNLGSPEAMLDRAVEELGIADGLAVLKVSSWYWTEPMGGPSGQEKYLNGVIEVVTSLRAQELLDRLLAIENRLGRKRLQRWGHIALICWHRQRIIQCWLDQNQNLPHLVR